MNTTDNNRNNYYIESVKKTEVEKKCLDKSFKVKNNISLHKNKGKFFYFWILRGVTSGFLKAGNYWSLGFVSNKEANGEAIKQ